MNLKAKYNAFMAEHPLLRGGAWLITKLFMLILVAILLVIEFLCSLFTGPSKEQTEGNNVVGDADRAARDLGYMDHPHWDRMWDDK